MGDASPGLVKKLEDKEQKVKKIQIRVKVRVRKPV
jgi:hypothetical protein